MSSTGTKYSSSVSVTTIHDNTNQEVVVVTIDRLKLALVEHGECLDRSRDWHTPATLLVALSTTFFTTDFKPFIGMAADVWRAVYVIITGLTIIWLLRALFGLRKRQGVDGLIEKVKKKG